MSELQPENPADVAKIEHFENIGDITIGVGTNWHIIATALCVLNDPNVNKFLLANKLKITDRITKTKIFPREGMSLPNGQVYSEPSIEEIKEI